MKYLGIFLMIVGLSAIVGKEFVPGVVLIVAGFFVFKKFNKPKVTKSKKVISSTPTENKAPKKNHFKFNVAGISKTNDKGKDIQKLIKEYVTESIEMGHTDKYEDMTNAEILESGREVYEVALYGDYEVELIPEPNNPYDPNAIRVIHSDIGHIGYVPRDFITNVKLLIDSECHLEWKLVGGKLKYIDYGEDKVKTRTLTYGIEVTLTN